MPPPLAPSATTPILLTSKSRRSTSFYEEVVARGAEIIKPLRDEPWRMREFGLRTVDGHRIIFGSPASTVLSPQVPAEKCEAMTRSDDLYSLPSGLPAPVDNGTCDRLTGILPSAPLRSTSGRHSTWQPRAVRSSSIAIPDWPPGHGSPGWLERECGCPGCTPQSCAFRDRRRELPALGAGVFGVGTQDTETRGKRSSVSICRSNC